MISWVVFSLMLAGAFIASDRYFKARYRDAPEVKNLSALNLCAKMVSASRSRSLSPNEKTRIMKEVEDEMFHLVMNSESESGSLEGDNVTSLVGYRIKEEKTNKERSC